MKYYTMYIVNVTHTWSVSLNLDCQITLKMLYGNLGKKGNFQGNFVLGSDAYFQWTLFDLRTWHAKIIQNYAEPEFLNVYGTQSPNL